jgi:hypothetical protein
LFAATVAHAAPFNHGVWETILKTNVDKDGYVDYDAIRISKGGDLYEYTSFLEDASLAGLSDAEKTAFWINAYNAFLVQKILAKPDLQKISDAPDMFDEKIDVARIKISLNDIEYRILFSDPQKGGAINGYSVPEDLRVHFALSRGTLGGPKLLNHAYTGASLNDKLQAAAVNFANNSRYIAIKDGQLHVSQIFDWYKLDFETDGGVPSYLSKLIDPKVLRDGQEILLKLESDYPDKTVFEYDWSLNHIRNRPKQ